MSDTKKERLCLNSIQAKKLFRLVNDFHDASIYDCKTKTPGTLMLDLRVPGWVVKKLSVDEDQLISCCFSLTNVDLLKGWGTDEEICQSSIYHFLINGSNFDIQTGDGGRTGRCSEAKSTVDIVTSSAIFAELASM